MIIKNLKLQAFGPYKNLVEIDFTKFNNQDIFLISGPTGSGKSTIFDGISYALYGTLANSDKSNQDIKSHYADHNIECFVELSFEHLGTDYKVTRSPKQTIIGKSGRVITQEANAKFSGGSYFLDKSKEIDNKIEQLIGLKANQFKQIVLLPQGEFQKLLIASSNDKLDLFRKIFNTELLNNFKIKLDEKSKSVKENISQLENTIEAQLEMLPIEFKNQLDYIYQEKTIDLIEKEVIKLKKEKESADIKLNSLTQKQNQLVNYLNLMKELKEAEVISSNLNNEVEKIKEKEKRINLHEISEKAQNIQNELTSALNKQNEYIEKLSNEKELLKNLTVELNNEDKVFKRIEVDYLSLKDKRIKLQKVKNLLDMFVNFEKYQTSIQELTVQLKKDQELLIEKEKESSLINQKLEKFIELEEKLKGLSSQLNELIEKKNQIEEQKEQRKALLKLERDYLVAQKQLQEAYQKQEYIQNTYHHQIAGILATDLVEGETCPVCGSIHHPLKATLVDEDISFDSVKSAQNDYQILNNQLHQIENSISSLKLILKDELETNALSSEEIINLENKLNKEINNLKTLLNDKPKLLINQNTFINTISSLKENIATRNGQIQELATAKKEIELKLIDKEEKSETEKANHLEKEIELIENTYNSTKDTLSKIITKKESSENTIKIFENEKKSYQNQSIMKEKELNIYLSTTKLDNNFIENLIDLNALNSLREAIKDFHNKNLVNKSQLKEIRTKLSQINLDKIKDLDLNTLEVEIIETKKELLTVSSKFDQFKSVSNIVSGKIKELLGKQSKSKDILELASYAAGNKKTGYLSFESYILALLYDDVISFANLRLKSLSQGQYYFKKLELEEGKIDGRARNVGLDLVIYDAYTGETRAVTSLSGGETFYASLALALGLSDVISNQLGGIQLDFLLIDEGFGSLDENTLEQAISALRSSSKTERLVGIISHVPKLREQISSQIIVDKTPYGSTISLQL